MKLVLVDVDHTLLSANSATGWIKAELKSGYVSIASFLEAVVWLARYRLGDARIEDAIRKSVTTLSGTYEADLIRRCETFNRDWVLPRVRTGAKNTIEAHKRAGDHICLLTSSTNYVAEALADSLELDGVLCNRFEVDDDGRFTGVALEPLCFGSGKLSLARAYADEHGLSIEDAVYYTDSYSDLPVLEAVGEPIIVHPDPRLAAVAGRRGWKRIDWGSSTA
ncbi:MAG: HAD family phosphatase [Myxococcota bacterium]